MSKFRQSVALIVVVLCAMRTLQAQSAVAPRVLSARLVVDATHGPAARASHSSPWLESALSASARQGAVEARRARFREVRVDTQTPSSKPFWTRTKLLIAGTATVVVGAIVIAEMRKTCRDQGPQCFD